MIEPVADSGVVTVPSVSEASTVVGSSVVSGSVSVVGSTVGSSVVGCAVVVGAWVVL